MDRHEDVTDTSQKGRRVLRSRVGPPPAPPSTAEALKFLKNPSLLAATIVVEYIKMALTPNLTARERKNYPRPTKEKLIALREMATILQMRNPYSKWYELARAADVATMQFLGDDPVSILGRQLQEQTHKVISTALIESGGLEALKEELDRRGLSFDEAVATNKPTVVKLDHVERVARREELLDRRIPETPHPVPGHVGPRDPESPDRTGRTPDRDDGRERFEPGPTPPGSVDDPRLHPPDTP